MARLRLSVPTLKDRLEVAAMVFGAATLHAGENSPETRQAVELLKECASHLYENQHPGLVDADGNPQPEIEAPIRYSRIIARLEQYHASDALKVSRGAPTTLTPRKN